MKKNSNWVFDKKPSRPCMSGIEARKLRRDLAKTLKIGIELEYNLLSSEKLCRRDDINCPCISQYVLPNGIKCEDTCSQHNSCELEKGSGCPDKDIFCVAFTPLCTTCKKADKGCSSCSKAWSEDKDPETIRQKVSEELEPTRFLGSSGKCGVLDVVKDNSLSGNGGIEVVTVGQRVSFAHMYNMCRNIIDVSKKYGAFVNERTSIHFHILSGYLSTSKYNPRRPNYGLPRSMEEGVRESKSGLRKPFEIVDLEQPIPEIVLANFHQLWRRFENAFIWISSSGDSFEKLTRWSKFRRSLLRFSALRNTMPFVIREISDHMDNNNRYGMVNYAPVKFTPKGGMISRLHFEIRASDGCLSPAAVAAQACLLHALLLKAVDLSRHGVLKSGDAQYMSEAREINKVLCNNSGDWGGPRTSNTSLLDPYYGTLATQATELVALCKSFLVDDAPAYDVLLSLAKQPISIRRCGGKSWEEIDKELMPENTSTYEPDKIMEIVDTASLTECDSPEQWIACVSEDSNIDKNKVDKIMKQLLESGNAFWNQALGSFCRR